MRNLKNIGKVLSRNEMRNVSAGLTDGGGFGGGDVGTCKDSSCQLYVYSLGKTVAGTCGPQIHVGSGLGTTVCKCFSNEGGYETGNGGTACYS